MDKVPGKVLIILDNSPYFVSIVGESGISAVKSQRQDRTLQLDMASQVTIPYQVLVNADGTCGGSILRSLLIITAARCVKGVPKHRISITAGTQEPWNESINKQVRKAETVIIHPRYRHAALLNDIALIILSKPLEFNTNVAGIELPRKDEEFEGRVTASGWGDTTEGGSGSNILKYVVLPIVPYAQCKRSYGYLRREQMCAGETGLDTCEGDSGGPVACKRKGYRKQILCVVTSRGNGCGRPGFPELLSRFPVTLIGSSRCEGKEVFKYFKSKILTNIF